MTDCIAVTDDLAALVGREPVSATDLGQVIANLGTAIDMALLCRRLSLGMFQLRQGFA